MTSYPAPTPSELETAFREYGVRYTVEAVRADSAGRKWSEGLRAIVDHHTAGSNSLAYLQNAGGSYPMVQTLISRDGVCHVLTWLSCWGPGDGGPWPGVAGLDSLHLTGWQNEVEDMGTGKTFTPAQLETLGRVNAALLSIGVPAGHEINHRDWTDGTGPVGGYPLPTTGRKIDTRYTLEELHANTARYRPGVPLPGQDGDDVLLLQASGTNGVYLLAGNQLTLVENRTDMEHLQAAGVAGPVIVSSQTFDRIRTGKD